MAPKHTFAVLVLNYNGQHFLKDCFASLAQQTRQNFDIWLIDNKSTDDSVRYTREKFPHVHILQINENLGYSGGYNYADNYFKGNTYNYQCYLLLNTDTVVSPSVIDDMEQLLNTDRAIGISFPCILDTKKSIDIGAGIFSFFSGTTLGYMHGKKYVKNSDVYECFWASGSS